ncbi:MAG: GNAT family N-acetyltransferase [Muribaculaceae bacterium]|nr:GNAT family N-acetyltransferase [Muribaculaceae bacterium]
MITVSKYNPSHKAAWDDMVRRSRNATFMHLRDYMDYHSDRFTDFSLMAIDGDSIIAVLPACINGDTLCSHAGLTYGGWLTPLRHFDVTTMLKVWESATGLMIDEGISTFIYKPVPHIYHRYPCEEDLYALFRDGGRLIESNISTTIDLDEPLPFDRGNKRNVNLAIKSGVKVGESGQWQEYWQVLNAVLNKKYGKYAVHSLEEIMLLQSRFPENIKLYTAALDGELLAGVVMYYCGNEVAHSQYIASTERGRQLKALTLLFDYLINEASLAGYRYFDFGTSNENGGLYLNEGLVQQKCRLGGRGIVYNIFRVELEK